MRRLRFLHIELSLGAALLVSALFVPWLTIYAFYSPGTTTTFVWSPFDIVWNALVSAFPGAPAVNA